MSGATTDTRPTVSVIIPTLNGGRWLDDLLIRLREQTLQPDEILVVDSETVHQVVDMRDGRVVTHGIGGGSDA